MKKGSITAEKREEQDLRRAVNALEGSQHNPIAFAPVVKLIAPIVARIAARYVLRTVSKKLGKRISSKIREDTVTKAADYLADIAVKRVTTKKK